MQHTDMSLSQKTNRNLKKTKKMLQRWKRKTPYIFILLNEGNRGIDISTGNVRLITASVRMMTHMMGLFNNLRLNTGMRVLGNLRMIIFVIVKKIFFQIMQRFPNSCTPKIHQNLLTTFHEEDH